MVLLVAAALAASRTSLCCSICRCGDATFNALGSNIYSPGAFRLAVDWERFDKAQGPADDRESTVENRVTATLSYSFADRVNLVARIPVSFRTLAMPNGGMSDSLSTSGLSDPEFSAWVRLWASALSPGVGRRSWVSLVGGVKTPWGRNNLSEGGVRLDEHAQAGTGSTDVFFGISLFYLIDPSSSAFVSVQYRHTGTNSHEYKYGNIALANVAYERKLGSVVDAVVEMNYRHAQRDRVDAGGDLDSNTGGDILYFTPRVIVDLGRGFLGRAAVQIPLVKRPYGDQTERVVVNAGLTLLF